MENAEDTILSVLAPELERISKQVKQIDKRTKSMALREKKAIAEAKKSRLAKIQLNTTANGLARPLPEGKVLEAKLIEAFRHQHSEVHRLIDSLAADIRTMNRKFLQKEYNEEEGRDQNGRWVSGGGSSNAGASESPKGPKMPPATKAPPEGEGSGDGPLNKPEGAGRKIEPPKSPEDVERFKKEVYASPEYKEIQKRTAGYAADTVSGKAWHWSKEKNSVNGQYTPERAKLHDQIADQMLNPEAVAEPGTKPKLVMLMGPPGAGKTTAGLPYASHLAKGFTTISADDVKTHIPGYKGYNEVPYQQESVDIAEHRLMPKAIAAKHNLLYDGSGMDTKRMQAMLDNAQKAGYDVHLIHVDTPSHVAAGRSWDRFQSNAFQWSDTSKPGGRFTDPAYVHDIVDGKTKQTFDTLKNHPAVKSYTSLSTDVPKGTAPKVLEQGHSKEYDEK